MGSQKQETTSEPWKAVQPMLKSFYGGAQDAYQSGTPVASTSPYTQQAQGMIAGLAGSGPSTINTEADLRGMLSSGPSDALMSSLDTAAGKTADVVNRNFGMIGRGGSVAHQNALTDSVGNLYTSALAGDEARREQQNLGILGQIGNIQQANLANQYMPAQMLGQIGQQQEATTNANSPWGMLQQYGGLLSGAGGLGGTTTSTQSGNPFQTALGLGLMGTQMLTGIPVGTAAGAAGRGGMGLGGGLASSSGGLSYHY